jgi:peptidoglycan hydrolase-like protein with peptidoglycan-binding domain
MKLKYIFLLLLICLQFFFVTESLNLENCYKKTFTVTWYYSPKLNQKIYYKWNYNSEIRLNWRWTNWASWKKVFNWMIAASKKYKFWTKIYFPKYGVWLVEDRWWAIVSAWQRWNKYDRIDIWMWAWESWLIRAISFGKQNIIWYVCNDKKLEIWFDYSKILIYKQFFEVSVWAVELYKWLTNEWVTILQKNLNKLWYTENKNITWYFWPITKKALCKYQTDKLIVSKNSFYCGHFGVTTRKYLKDDMIKLWYFSNRLYADKIKDYLIKSDWYVSFESPFYFWQKWDKIKTLQKYLNKLWYLTEKNITWKFWYNTKTAICKYQVKTQLTTKKSWICWYFWPATRLEIVNDIKKIDKQKIEEIQNQNYLQKSFDKLLKKWEKSEEVKRLQINLKQLWYYSWNESWIYDSETLESVYAFQLTHGILNKDSYYNLRWYFWSKTRKILNEKIKW